jgi:DNA-directed RNA polymerase specialized sigma24 family protein
MSNQDDDALPKRKPGSKAPTAEEVRALAEQIKWLQKNIKWQALRQIAYHRTDDAVVADESVRDVYHRMLRWSVEELEGFQNPQAYARQAVIHRVIDLRAPFNGRISLSDGHENILEVPSPEEELATRDQVIALLAELPESWREPLVYTVVYGFTIEETAAKLHLTYDTVKKRAANALKYLRIRCGVIPPDSLLERVKKLLRLEGRGP